MNLFEILPPKSQLYEYYPSNLPPLHCIQVAYIIELTLLGCESFQSRSYTCSKCVDWVCQLEYFEMVNHSNCLVFIEHY